MIPASGRHARLEQERHAMKLAILAVALLAAGTANASRGPHYGGGHHTSSHGGHFSGSYSGSSHRGGHYTSRVGSHSYGSHK
jgi:hypothetical protein